MWDGVLLAESLANSLMILCVAAWFWLVSKWCWPRVALVLAPTFLWIFCRDAHASVGIAIAAFLFCLVARKPRDLHYWVLALSYALFSSLSLSASNRAERWIFPFHNILGKRILPYWVNRSIFLENGMPLNGALMERSGTWAGGDGRAFDFHPKLVHFREWRDSDGRKTYLKFLFLRFGWALQEPIRHGETMLDPSVWTYAPAGFPMRATPFARFLYFKGLVWVLVILAAVMLGSAIVLARVPAKPGWWVAILLIVSAYGHALAVYHGDAMELARHSVGVALQLRLGFWLLVLLLLDHWLSRVKDFENREPQKGNTILG